jgi:hypothetical protein
VWAILNRHGCSRVRAERRESVRYEWPGPGDLVHVDVKRYPRFRRPGHAATGNRSKTGWDTRHLMGWDYFHAMVDDHSRLAYGELLADEKGHHRHRLLRAPWPPLPIAASRSSA